MAKSDYESLIRTALASPRVETAEKLKRAEAEIKRLEPMAKEPMAKQASLLEKDVLRLHQEIRNRDETIEKQMLNIQGINQVNDRDIRDLRYRISRLEKEKKETVERVNKVLGRIDPVEADRFVREWRAEEGRELNHSRGMEL